jgi:branched-chain amino acid aminotransferase
MRLLRLDLPPSFTPESLREQILDLCNRNGHSAFARVRLMVFRGEGHLFDTADNFAQYVIESSALVVEQILFNMDGLRVGVYPDGRKACDPLANLKSNNFLLYAQAARYGQDQGWDDCMVLNGHERLADSCIANLFYIREGEICTPPLTEGCVAGVMRRWLMERMPGWGFTVREKPVGMRDLAGADEIFLTNAVRIIRWVGDHAGKTYGGRLARELYELVVKEA